MSVLPESVARVLRSEFGIDVRDAIPLRGGDEAASWKIEGASGEYVTRVDPPWRALEDVRWIGDVVGHVARECGCAPGPLGVVSVGDRPLSVVPFVVGSHVDGHDPMQLRAGARALASIHRTLRGWPGPAAAPRGTLTRAHEDASNDPPELVDHELDRHVDRWAEERPGDVALVHGDYWGENLIWTGVRAVAIDWHEMRRRPQAMELAWAAYECTREEASPELDAPRIGVFLDAYATAGGHLPDDIEAMFVPFIRTMLRENLRAVRAIQRTTHEAWANRETACFRALRDQRLT